MVRPITADDIDNLGKHLYDVIVGDDYAEQDNVEEENVEEGNDADDHMEAVDVEDGNEEGDVEDGNQNDEDMK